MKKITSITAALFCLASIAASASAYSYSASDVIDGEYDFSEQLVDIASLELEESEEIKAVVSENGFQAVLIGDISDTQDVSLSCYEEEIKLMSAEEAMLLTENADEKVVSIEKRIVLYSSGSEESSSDRQSNNYAEAYSTITYTIKDSSILGDLKEVNKFSGGWNKLDSAASISKMSAEWYFSGKSKITAKVSGYTFSAPGSALPNRATLHAKSKATITYNGKNYTLLTDITI